ncbi:MAG: Eco57I restriction-modification methylase domain-containing protein, partial [Planctomycetes bacterium]|nr:Eco57I restriction-modification methylase domain-containing protein [Planctomycetota bacterium]
DDNDAIFQAKQYAWNSTIPFAVLTDFEQFRLYDTTLKPIFNDSRRGLVKEFALDYDQYESQWDVLSATFGRTGVEGGSLERLLASIKKVKAGKRLRTVDRMLIDLKGGEPVDRVFLSYLDTHRRHFAAALYRDNKAAFPEADTLHGAAKLTEAVQRIMDRLVFMRVIEDRGIVPFGTLREMLERIGTEGGEFYTALCATFRDYDASYNGYLYKPHFSEELSVDGGVLADFTRTLYPPDGPWDFAAIGDDILGTVYERFLGNTIVVKRGQATVEEKLEVRHAGGVYYTPRFVVDSIIRRVVGPKLQGKTPAEVLDVKILDPACGSGSFLVAALQYLFDDCLAKIAKDPALAKAHVSALAESARGKGRKKKAELAFQDKEGRWYLAPDFRAALLTHCIHGVDIDQQAVEVTVMSLYLKMLESKLPENWATLWVERQLLPPLDNNIRCGNSLIDEESYLAFRERKGKTQKDFLKPESTDTVFRINRFDWNSETGGFGRVLKPVDSRGRTVPTRGFDCIIGNPPYIRVQELNKWAPEECEFYKSKYKSAAKGNYDIYVVFTERALSLLAPDGLLGFIMPHKFWQAQYGAGLRKLITDGKHLKAVVDFAHHQVFQNATTYTAIHVLQRSVNGGAIDYAAFADLTDGVAQCAAIDILPERQVEGVTRRRVSTLAAGGSPFSFGPPVAFDPEGKFKPLSEVADLAQGFKTGADKVFVVTLVKEANGIAKVHSEETEREYEIESATLRPLVKSEHMKAFDLLPSPLRLIFPYLSEDKGWRLATPAEMEERFPLLWKGYLPEMRAALDKREKGRFKGERFYQYSRPQNFEPLSKPKIINPDICEHPQMCWDASGRSVFSGGAAGGVAIVPTKAIDAMLLIGILNSKLADNWIRANGTLFRGGYLNCEIRFIRDLPIKLPKTAEDKKLAARITESVRAIMEAKAALRQPKLSDREIKQHEAAIEP